MHDDFRAADTCCALPSDAPATRYLLLNRCLSPAPRVTLDSVSCATARERGKRRPGSLAARGRTSLARAWLTSTHTPLLLNYRLQGAGGGDTKTNLRQGDMAVQKRQGAAGRVHSSPTGWFREVGERARGSSGRRLWAGHKDVRGGCRRVSVLKTKSRARGQGPRDLEG